MCRQIAPRLTLTILPADPKRLAFASSCRSLLLLIVALGLVSAIAFSSSYQLVARFANKSVIALGLGCVGSGIVVLFLELAMRMKTRPTTAQLIWLFELTAGALTMLMCNCSMCDLSSTQLPNFPVTELPPVHLLKSCSVQRLQRVGYSTE